MAVTVWQASIVKIDNLAGVDLNNDNLAGVDLNNDNLAGGLERRCVKMPLCQPATAADVQRCLFGSACVQQAQLPAWHGSHAWRGTRCRLGSGGRRPAKTAGKPFLRGCACRFGRQGRSVCQFGSFKDSHDWEGILGCGNGRRGRKKIANHPKPRQNGQ